MVNNIFHAEGTLRHQVYFSIIVGLLGWPTVGLFYWGVCFLLYWDEFKSEFLDYDEFLEECLELFEINLNHHLEAAGAWHTLVTKHHTKPGRSYPADMYSQQSAYDRHADFDEGRLMNIWDHPEIYPLWFMSEWLQEEWDFLAETEIEPTCQQSMDDLEAFYLFYSEDQKIDLAQNNNKHWLFERDYISHPIVGHGRTSQLLSMVDDPVDFWDYHSYMTSARINDLRCNYWSHETASPVSSSVKK